jgi:hypothetical protein
LRIIYSIVSRLGCKHFPRNYDAMAERFGLSAVLEKKLKVVPHCPDCGRLVRHPPDPTIFEEGKDRCEFCDGYTYAVRAVGDKRCYIALEERLFIDPYHEVAGFMHDPSFWNMYQQGHKNILRRVATTSVKQEHAEDWLNEYACGMIREYPEETKYDPEDGGTVPIFLIQVTDDMSTVEFCGESNGKSYETSVCVVLNLPREFRHGSEWVFPTEVSNSPEMPINKKFPKAALYRQEQAQVYANEWKDGRVVSYERDGKTITSTLRIFLLFVQADGPKAIKLAGRLGTMNPQWWFYDFSNLVSIKVGQHSVQPASLNLSPKRTTKVELESRYDDVMSEEITPADAGLKWKPARRGGLEHIGIPGLPWYDGDLPGFDHIEVGRIKRVFAVVTDSMPPVNKEALAKSITSTVVPRGGEPVINWLPKTDKAKTNHGKIHPALYWFAHLALPQLWHLITDDKVKMMVLLYWIHFVHVRQDEPTENDLEISKNARLASQLMLEEHCYARDNSYQIVAPNDTKVRSEEHCVWRHIVLNACSELIVDSATKEVVESCTRNLTNGSGMKTALVSTCFKRLVAVTRKLASVPEQVPGAVACYNLPQFHFHGTGKHLNATDVCMGDRSLLQEAMHHQGFTQAKAKDFSSKIRTLMCFSRARFSHMHRGRGFSTITWDAAVAKRSTLRHSTTTCKRGSYMLVCPTGGARTFLEIHHLFVIESSSSGLICAFASGLAAPELDSSNEYQPQFSTPPSAPVVIPLLPGGCHYDAVYIMSRFVASSTNPDVRGHSAERIEGQVTAVPSERILYLPPNVGAFVEGKRNMMVARTRERVEKEQQAAALAQLNKKLDKTAINQMLKADVVKALTDRGMPTEGRVPDLKKELIARVNIEAMETGLADAKLQEEERRAQKAQKSRRPFTEGGARQRGRRGAGQGGGRGAGQGAGRVRGRGGRGGGRGEGQGAGRARGRGHA